LADDRDRVAAGFEEGEGRGVFALVDDREGADVVGGEDEFAEVVGLARVGVGDYVRWLLSTMLSCGSVRVPPMLNGAAARDGPTPRTSSVRGPVPRRTMPRMSVELPVEARVRTETLVEFRGAGDVAEIVDLDEDDAGGVGVAGDLRGVAAAGGGGRRARR